jgi:hypothetical protein
MNSFSIVVIRFIHKIMISIIKICFCYLIIINFISLNTFFCNSYSVLNCCKLLKINNNDYNNIINNNLIECVNSSNSYTIQNHISTKIAFAIYSSKDIYSYSSHTSLVIAYYLEKYNYHGKILSEDTGNDYNPLDRRWNKILSTIKSFRNIDINNNNNGWAKDYDILVFIDAGLVILEFDLNIENISSSYPSIIFKT